MHHTKKTALRVGVLLSYLSILFTTRCNRVPSFLYDMALNPHPTPSPTPQASFKGQSTPALGSYLEPPLFDSSPSLHDQDQTLPSPTPTVLAATTSLIPDMRTTSDLLYLYDLSLLRWDYVTGYSSLLLKDVHSFSTSLRGEIIALVRPLHVAANGIELFNLDIFNFSNKQTTTIVEKIPLPAQILLSPDGRQVAYLRASSPPALYIVPISNPKEVKEIPVPLTGDEKAIENLAWSPDSQSLIWSDWEAIWLAEVSSTKVHPILTNLVEVHDPDGSPIQISVRFEDFKWSPIGRYLTLKLIPSDEGVRWYALLDTKTSRLIRIPYSEEYHHRKPALLWDEAGNLIEAAPAEPPSLASPTIFIWKIIPTQNDLLVLQNTFMLLHPSVAPGSEALPATENLSIQWLNFVHTTLLGMAVFDYREEAHAAIYFFDLAENVVQKFIDIPMNTCCVFWSPDQHGALLITEDHHFYYFSTTGTYLQPLDDILGEDSMGWQWLSPLPRDG